MTKPQGGMPGRRCVSSIVVISHKVSHRMFEIVLRARYPSLGNLYGMRHGLVAVLCAVAVALLSILITCCCETRRGGQYAVRRKEMEIGHQLENDEERQFLEYQYGYKS
ncbi:hypothetical protein KIN20_001371 [Parelaphostrongylus tenuis]|uniref:Uncharacterized protein n=1 Tax=Parelaphostrongylus tenuis TaxID=148309 RepID=A0AAD5QEH7_PARTN|nr:hypothetical protein KIN20_001371 [Parelaphostrongylus tenuis]